MPRFVALLLMCSCGPQAYTASECVELRAAPSFAQTCPRGSRQIGDVIGERQPGLCCAPYGPQAYRAPPPPRPR